MKSTVQQQLVVPPNPNPTATATIASIESIKQSITILVGAWTWQMWQEHVRAARRSGVNHYGVASSSNWSKSICNPETGIVRITRFLKTIASFQR